MSKNILIFGIYVFFSIIFLASFQSVYAKPPPDPCKGYALKGAACGDSSTPLGAVCCEDDSLVCMSPSGSMHGYTCYACSEGDGQTCDPSGTNPKPDNCCQPGLQCVAQTSGNGLCSSSGVQPTVNLKNPCPSGYCTTAIGNIPTDVSGFISMLFRVVLSLAGGGAIIMIIYGGYRLSLSQGNPEKVQQSREIITSAIVGLLFIIFSVTILQIIGVDILGLTNIFSK